MTGLLPIKGSTALHAIALTVALAVVSSQYKSSQVRLTSGQSSMDILQVQLETNPTSLDPRIAQLPR